MGLWSRTECRAPSRRRPGGCDSLLSMELPARTIPAPTRQLLAMLNRIILLAKIVLSAQLIRAHTCDINGLASVLFPAGSHQKQNTHSEPFLLNYPGITAHTWLRGVRLGDGCVLSRLPNGDRRIGSACRVIGRPKRRALRHRTKSCIQHTGVERRTAADGVISLA